MNVAIRRNPQQWFLDREKVIKRLERKRVAAMAKMGGFIRTTAQRSIRPGRYSSQPGQPPRSHTGELRRNIYFAYDPTSDSVVVGPTAFRNSGVPEALEFGGTVQVKNRLIIQRKNLGKTRSGRDRQERQVAGRYTGPLTIKARPFMGPALFKSRTRLPEIWAQAISK